MPRPKEPRARAAAQLPTQNDDSDTLDKPSWDSSPHASPLFRQKLVDWLPSQNPRFRFLVETGATVDRSFTCCFSDNHIDSLVQGTHDMGTFERPLLVDATTWDPVAANIVALAGDRGDITSYKKNKNVIGIIQGEMFDTIASCIRH